MGSGRIDGYQAWVIHDMIFRLVGDEHIAAVEADILARAPGLTGGQIRSRLARLIAGREPEAFSRRHEQAMADRRVSANAGDPGAGLDGMGSLWFSHAAVDIAAAPDGVWRRLLSDPAGNLADLSTQTYRPGRVLDLVVTARDGASRFPRSNAVGGGRRLRPHRSISGR